jgi:hypothetical protein
MAETGVFERNLPQIQSKLAGFRLRYIVTMDEEKRIKVVFYF